MNWLCRDWLSSSSFRTILIRSPVLGLALSLLEIGFMMTSSNGNIFRITGHLCEEFTGRGKFPVHRPVTRSFDVFFDLCLNKGFSKQSWGWWFETQSRPSWRHCNILKTPGPWFNIKMSSYQCRKSHGGDKAVGRSSYLHNGISYTVKTVYLYWIGAQGTIQNRTSRHTVRFHKVAKIRDRWLKFSNCFEIWQSCRQRCCRCILIPADLTPARLCEDSW